MINGDVTLLYRLSYYSIVLQHIYRPTPKLLSSVNPILNIWTCGFSHASMFDVCRENYGWKSVFRELWLSGAECGRRPGQRVAVSLHSTRRCEGSPRLEARTTWSWFLWWPESTVFASLWWLPGFSAVSQYLGWVSNHLSQKVSICIMWSRLSERNDNQALLKRQHHFGITQDFTEAARKVLNSSFSTLTCTSLCYLVMGRDGNLDRPVNCCLWSTELPSRL